MVAPSYRFDLSPAEVKVILDALRQCGQTVQQIADAINKTANPHWDDEEKEFFPVMMGEDALKIVLSAMQIACLKELASDAGVMRKGRLGTRWGGDGDGDKPGAEPHGAGGCRVLAS